MKKTLYTLFETFSRLNYFVTVGLKKLVMVLCFLRNDKAINLISCGVHFLICIAIPLPRITPSCSVALSQLIPFPRSRHFNIFVTGIFDGELMEQFFMVATSSSMSMKDSAVRLSGARSGSRALNSSKILTVAQTDHQCPGLNLVDFLLKSRLFRAINDGCVW